MRQSSAAYYQLRNSISFALSGFNAGTSLIHELPVQTVVAFGCVCAFILKVLLPLTPRVPTVWFLNRRRPVLVLLTRFLGARLVFIVLLAAPYVQLAEAQQQLPRDVMDRFCKLDAAGKRLNPVGAKDLAKVLLRDDSWDKPSEVLLIREYSIRPLSLGKATAEFEVEYRVVGKIDPSLHLIRLQRPYTNEPIVHSERFSLALSDTHFERRNDWRLQELKGHPQWKIKTAPSIPHVNVAAALQYVRMASYRSKDPVVKMRAQETLMELESLQQARAMAAEIASPADILSQFIELQTDGTGLTSEGTKQLNTFLVHPAQWRQDKIRLAKTYAVGNTTFNGDKATISVDYTAAGELDAQMRFTSMQASGDKVRQDYKFVLDNRYSVPARRNLPATEFTGPSRWRIENASPEQWLTLEVAIRYLSQVRQTATDPTIRANAEKSLAALLRLR